jgi:hypothetical protein
MTFAQDEHKTGEGRQAQDKEKHGRGANTTGPNTAQHKTEVKHEGVERHSRRNGIARKSEPHGTSKKTSSRQGKDTAKYSIARHSAA